MKSLFSRQITDIFKHLSNDFSTLRIGFSGGHRETLLLLNEPGTDGLVTGKTAAGHRIDFDMADVCSIVYVEADEKVMTPEDIEQYKLGPTTVAQVDGPVRVRRRSRKPAVKPATEQPDGQPEKARAKRAPVGDAKPH